MATHSLASQQIVFLGAGSMAEAIIRGLVAGRIAPADHITAVNRSNAQRLSELRERFGIRTTTDDEKETAVRAADIVVLAMKPKDAAQALLGLRGLLRQEQLLVSVIAGMPIATIDSLVATGMTVVRTMPNTSSTIGLGATGISFSAGASAEQRELGLALFAGTGIVVTVDEPLLDVVTSVSGSGPAYFYYIMEAMIAAGVAGGLMPEDARTLTVQTALGAATMVQTTGEAPADLRRKVTSPNGTTQAALETLEAAEVGAAFAAAMRRCAERAGELGTAIGADAERLSQSKGANE
ncbi:MAG: pyrroline-5-carboxylate reductase [Paenibacillaceae bacterium]|nr:pyrroline-5-carboxylate reductase [Paenibacillaceae bacterium]